MQSNFFNSFFGFYMIFNYFIQPVFMVLVVFFLFRIAKHMGNVERQNRELLEKNKALTEKTETCGISDDLESNDNQ